MRKLIFETIIHSNIKAIWKIITDNEHYSWRSDISEIKIIEPHHTFIEISKNGIQTVFIITAIKPYALYEFDMENKYFYGHWIDHFHEHSEEKTKIFFTEILNIKNPIMKMFSYVFMNLKGMQKKYISDLIKELSKEKTSNNRFKLKTGKIQLVT